MGLCVDVGGIRSHAFTCVLSTNDIEWSPNYSNLSASLTTNWYCCCPGAVVQTTGKSYCIDGFDWTIVSQLHVNSSILPCFKS